MLAMAVAAGLAGLRLAAPGRTDLLLAAGIGAAFAAALCVGGHEIVRRASARSAERAIQAFLALMTVKMVAYAAFLLVTGLLALMDLAAAAGGLVGTTLVGEALAIEGLRRKEAAQAAERTPPGPAATIDGGAPEPDSPVIQQGQRRT
jgi:hypothetical protein